MNKTQLLILSLCLNLIPIAASASLEGAMLSLRNQMSTIFLPALSLVGIAIAAISMAMGHQNAKSHITMAVVGTIIGFGADNIIDYVRRTFGGV
jgi:lipoprotein signal peptidase